MMSASVPAQQAFRRHIVLAVEESETSKRAVAWACTELYRPGDRFHVTHVLSERPKTINTAISHIAQMRQQPNVNDQELVDRAIAVMMETYGPILAEHNIPAAFDIVLPEGSEAVGAALHRRVKQLNAPAIVLARSTKPNKPAYIGTATKHILENCWEAVNIIKH